VATPASVIRAVRLTSSGGKASHLRSSLGTVFEWYDFYIYATLEPFFASVFFLLESDHGAPQRVRQLPDWISWFGRSAHWCSVDW